MPIEVGQTIPEGTFKYVPYTPELENPLACGAPKEYKTSEWKGKKVVVVSVPGAFTPTCHQDHLPGFIKNREKFLEKGVDTIVFLAANDPFVMSAWGRVEGLKDTILTVCDPNAAWSAKLGYTQDLTRVGFGIRTGRYALIVDDLVVKFIAAEEDGLGLEKSSAEKVLAKL